MSEDLNKLRERLDLYAKDSARPLPSWACQAMKEASTALSRLQAAEERAEKAEEDRDSFKSQADEHALFDAETDLAFKDLDAQIADLTEENVRMREALERIARWSGEFPETGQTWNDGSPMSYGAAFGSNGERDYMREVARAALKTGA